MWRQKGRLAVYYLLCGIAGVLRGFIVGEEAAEELARHWGEQFAERAGDPSTFSQFSNFVQQVPGEVVWQVPKDEIAKMMLRKMQRNSLTIKARK